MKGATPVPGPIIMKGTDWSEGGRKRELGLRLTWIWGQELKAFTNNESLVLTEEIIASDRYLIKMMLISLDMAFAVWRRSGFVYFQDLLSDDNSGITTYPHYCRYL